MIELLIASVIIASGASLLVGGLISANRASDHRVQQVIATQLLASQLAMIDEEITPATPMHGTCPEPFENATWMLALTDTDLPSVKQVTLTINDQGRLLHATTLRRFNEQPQT